jgi:glycosyltransferase involved in cell wall biosynthesis
MRVLVFGTYDAAMHPRIATVAEGLRASGVEVTECNAPLGLDTAGRVAMLTQPWRVAGLLVRIARCWTVLARAARGAPRPDAVLVGYLGHFDVHLARLIFRRVPVLLDHLVGASDTARDRRAGGGARGALLTLIDSAALRAADVILVDTEEHLAALPERHRPRGVVVPVGAPTAWSAFPGARPEPGPGGGEHRSAGAPRGAQPEPGLGGGEHRSAGILSAQPEPGPLRIVFYGLYTPLQGTPVIGAALAALAGSGIEVTMIGTGQDAAEARHAAAANPDVRWLDWVPAAELPGVVAAHDVCLGIFGTGPKARRVVPNKVFQGAAAGCAIVTSDTPPQRRALGDAAVLVPPGDPDALAGALRRLAGDRAELDRLRDRAGRLARERFSPTRIVAPLLDRLSAVLSERAGDRMDPGDGKDHRPAVATAGRDTDEGLSG